MRESPTKSIPNRLQATSLQMQTLGHRVQMRENTQITIADVTNL